MPKKVNGQIIVFSGISGSGKSTLGEMLQDFLTKRGRRVVLLDGDSLRDFFEGSLGYSGEDRLMVSKILAYVAIILAAQNTDVILATMLSQAGARDFFKKKASFIEIFCDAELDQVMKNDTKKVYREAMASEVPNIVGHDLAFERPKFPDLTIKSHERSIEGSFQQVVQFLRSRGLFGLSQSESS
jgi:adenylylsulfate kinase-like enzyme